MPASFFSGCKNRTLAPTLRGTRFNFEHFFAERAKARWCDFALMYISQCKVCWDVCCLFTEAVLSIHDLTIWLSAVHQEAETVFLLDLASVIESREGPQKEQEHTRGQQAAAVTAAYVSCSKTQKLRKQPACLASEQVVLERGGLLQPVQLSCPGENSQTNLGPGQFMPSLHRISKAAASDILPHSSRIRYPPIFSPRGICSFEDSDGTTQKIGPDAAQPSILLVVLKGLKARSYNSRTLAGGNSLGAASAS